MESINAKSPPLALTDIRRTHERQHADTDTFTDTHTHTHTHSHTSAQTRILTKVEMYDEPDAQTKSWFAEEVVRIA